MPASLARTLARASSSRSVPLTATCWSKVTARTFSHTSTARQTDDSTTTHFGFKTVPSSMKETLVRNVFSNVASSYDIMNDAMSLGIHRLWKDHFLRTMAPAPNTRLLDVAGGTGDIAQRFLEYQDAHGGSKGSSVHMVDINPEMLAEGERRFAGSRWAGEERIAFSVGNAENLEFVEDASVDYYTIAFGIRNCTHPERVVQEAHRVLRPGGRFMCLEFSRVENPVLATLYDLHSFH
ncbi:hypothetical protein GGI05_006555, partial [Coemansia sp. RSA 2603]